MIMFDSSALAPAHHKNTAALAAIHTEEEKASDLAVPVNQVVHMLKLNIWPAAAGPPR